MRGLSRDLREQLAELDFEQWAQTEGVTYRRTVGKHGRELNIHECPTCGNRDWKVYFNPNTKVGVCFAGSHPQDKQFNAFVFIKEYTGLSGRALNTYIESQLLEQGWKPKKPAKLESAVKLTGEIFLPLHIPLPLPDGRIPDYLVERNITPELCQYFDIRFSIDGLHTYTNPDSGQLGMQDFSMRILIPIYDLTGKMATFQGRDVTGLAKTKYLFPSTLPASGRFLYNGHNALGKSTVVIGEGVFDVWAIKRALFADDTLRDYVEPIATFGMHLSGGTSMEQQDQFGAFLALKAAGLQHAVMMWDTEKQAMKNTVEAAKKLTSIGLKVKIASLGSEGQDPGDSTDAQILKAYYTAQPFTPRLALQMLVQGPESLAPRSALISK